MEKLRKDFKVNQTQHAFHCERMEAKREYNEQVKLIRRTTASAIACLKNDFDMKVRKHTDAMDEAIRKEGEKLNQRTAAIAEKEDAFWDELRNYAASLPEDERKAWNGEGGMR